MFTTSRGQTGYLKHITDLLLGTAFFALAAQAGVRNASFDAPKAFPTTAWTSVAAGDFNGDGKMDLALAGAYNGVSVLLGNGDGTFQPQVNYLFGTDPRSLVVADFNGDGKLDLAVADYAESFVFILLGNGDGTFQPPVSYAGGCSPDALAVADFNGDGKVDLAISDYGCGSGGNVSILLGNGDGTFQPASAYPACPHASGADAIAIGDFDGNGIPDVAAVCQTAGEVSILLGNGDGTFEPHVNYAAGSLATAIAVGDFNRDGKLDLAVAVSATGTSGSVSILQGNGDGTFQPKVSLALAISPATIIVGNFSANGRADLLVAAGNGSGGLLLLPGNGNGSFQSPKQQLTAFEINEIPAQPILAAADFNNDGTLDIAVPGHNSVSVFLGKGKGSFTQPVTFPAGKGPFHVAVADFNADGKQDLAVTDTNSGVVSILLGNGKGAFHAPVSYAAGSQPGAVAVADFNGDGKLDLAIANSKTNTVSVLLGNGDGTFQPPVSYTVGTSPVSIAVGDFNGDGKPDLVVATVGVRTISILLGNGDGTFQPQMTDNVGGKPAFVVVGDFNGDGIADLAVAANPSGCQPGCGISILIGKGNGTFQAPVSYPVGVTTSIAVADLNGDGKLDLAGANGDVFIMLGNGDGTFQPQVGYSVGYGADALVVGDFNSDGVPDVAVQANNVVAFLLGTGNGAFALQDVAYVAGTGSPAIGDFNGDGKPDLAFTDQFFGRVAILTNTTQ